MNVKNLLWFPGIFFLSLKGKCQVSDSPEVSMAKVRIFTFHSRVLNEDRKIYIYHPQGDSLYLSQSSYPALYLMDAEEQAGMTIGQVIYLSESYSILPPR